MALLVSLSAANGLSMTGALLLRRHRQRRAFPLFSPLVAIPVIPQNAPVAVFPREDSCIVERDQGANSTTPSWERHVVNVLKLEALFPHRESECDPGTPTPTRINYARS
jgi:hypothetical protein